MDFGLINSVNLGLTLNPETTRTVDLDNSMSTSEIQAVIDSVGKYIPFGQTVTFQLANGTYTLDDLLQWAGFEGGGNIIVQGDTSQGTALHTNQNVFLDFSGTDTDGLYFYNSTCPFYLKNVKVKMDTTSGSNSSVKINLAYIQVWSSYILGDSRSLGRGVAYENMSQGNVNNTYFENIRDSVYVATGSVLDGVYGCAGTGTLPFYGVRCNFGGRVGSANANIDSYGSPYYIDGENGNIAAYPSYTVNLTTSHSGSEITDILSGLPKYIRSGTTVTIQFADGTYNLSSNVQFYDFTGRGNLYIYGNTGESLALHTNQAVIFNFSGNVGVKLYHCSCTWRIHNIKIQSVDVSGQDIYISGCWPEFQSKIDGCYVVCAGKTAIRTLIDVRGSACTVQNTYVSNGGFGVVAEYNSHVHSNNNSSTGTAPNYGLFANFGAAAIGKQGTQPTGTTANEGSGNGGVIR